jgi:predicted ATP-grasp superfamily ATP-dependent carboligase
MIDAAERLAVGVVGASGRAAVASLVRAGFAAWAVDLFADRDLKRMAPCVRCPADDYPDALPQLACAFPPGPVIYTGGLENRPDVVRELAARRPLWGNPPEVLAQVRDPFRLNAALAGAGFHVPRVLPGGPAPPGRWLRKPVRSAGGHGIRFATPDDRPDPAFYLQEFIDGTPMSALFLSFALLCVTEQLAGEAWLHAGPFRYAGNVGPVQSEQPWADDLHHLGTVLTTAFGLRGVWGVDFLLRAGRAWPVEVNPRYTASMEVFEYHYGTTVLPQHGIAFGAAADIRCGPAGIDRILGKAIYFAPHRIVFPASGPWDADLSGKFEPWRHPGFADIPEPGEVIEPGSPGLTFFADGSTPDECRSRLQSTAAELDDLFSRAAQTTAETSP